MKSKRPCEGYNQRVVFKDPLGAYQYAGPFGHFGYGSGLTSHYTQLSSQQSRAHGHGILPTIAPKPPSFDYQQYHRNPSYGVSYGQAFAGPSNPVAGYDVNHEARIALNTFPQQSHTLIPYAPQPVSQPLVPVFRGELLHDNPDDQPLDMQGSGIMFEGVYSGQHAAQRNPAYPQATPNFQQQPCSDIRANSDSDASYPDSDEGEMPSKVLMAPVVRQMNCVEPRTAAVRTFASLSLNNVVGEYMDSPYATELKDSAKRQLFEHFIRVTGPSISLYERHPYDFLENISDEMMANGGTSLWTREFARVICQQPSKSPTNVCIDTFPTMALYHPALLHAMLAMASLQVAKLRKIPPTAAHKHYHLSLRRVAKNVKSTSRRLHPATLAATLLLAFFEVYDSDHTKWCSHLYGACTLLAELSIRTMAQRCLPVRSLRDRQKLANGNSRNGSINTLPADPNAIDFELVSILTGSYVSPEDYDLCEHHIWSKAEPEVTAQELETFENTRDLLWWYYKMDIYQTLLGGTKLLHVVLCLFYARPC